VLAALTIAALLWPLGVWIWTRLARRNVMNQPTMGGTKP